MLGSRTVDFMTSSARSRESLSRRREKSEEVNDKYLRRVLCVGMVDENKEVNLYLYSPARTIQSS